MFCSNCGFQLNGDARFCQRCGTSQENKISDNDKITNANISSYLNDLHIAEQAVNSVWPCKKAVDDTQNKISIAQNSILIYKKSIKEASVVIGICTGILVLYLCLGLVLLITFEPYHEFLGPYHNSFWSSPKSDLYKMFLYTILFFCGSMDIIAVIVILNDKNKSSKASKEISLLEKQLSEHKKRYSQLYSDAILIKKIKIAEQNLPSECMNPEYARVYISAVESGRAKNAQEALQFFDLFIRHQQMQKLGKEIKGAVIEARNAAERAESAANNAYYNSRR